MSIYGVPPYNQREVQILLCYESGPAAQTVYLVFGIEIDTTELKIIRVIAA